MSPDSIIEQLAAFRRLPTYQLERRIDPFVMLYLEPAFNAFLGTNDIRFIYPEWPLFRTNDQSEDLALSTTDNRANYADYLLYSRAQNRLVMVEFKTDKRSIGADQLHNYLLNCRMGWEGLWERYLSKALHNKVYWRKFCYGVDWLYQQAPELTGFATAPALDRFYGAKSGVGKTAHLQGMADSRSEVAAPRIQLVVLAPEACRQSIETWMNDASGKEEHYAGFLSLMEFARVTHSPLRDLLLAIEGE